MRANMTFVGTLWIMLIALWLVSGEQLIDLVFAMPDIGPVDDALITGVVWVEDIRAGLGIPDLFTALRAVIHGWAGF